MKTDILASFPAMMANVREKEPIVQAITNFVTVNDCANIILAAGASPTMAHEVEEVAEVASVVQGLVMNMGTMEDVEAMLVAGKAANEAGVPVVLDPVAVGATRLRREGGKKLLENVKFSVIRGNTSEIKHLAVGTGSTRGVDAAEEDKSPRTTTKPLDIWQENWHGKQGQSLPFLASLTSSLLLTVCLP